VAKVIERVRPRYEVQDVEFGKVYKWCPERVVVECGCGERLALGASRTDCDECGTDHAVAVREETPEWHQQSDKALHPWRYSEDRKDAGLPF
jgi:hypothetical protein